MPNNIVFRNVEKELKTQILLYISKSANIMAGMYIVWN